MTDSDAEIMEVWNAYTDIWVWIAILYLTGVTFVALAISDFYGFTATGGVFVGVVFGWFGHGGFMKYIEPRLGDRNKECGEGEQG